MSEQQPDVERLLTAPEEAERVPAGAIPGVLARLASLQLRVAGLEAALLARLHVGPSGRAGAGDRLLDMETVAKVLAVPVAHAREMGRRHEIPTVRVGRYVRVRESSLLAWLQQREEAVGEVRSRAYSPRPRRTEARAAGARVVAMPGRDGEAER